MYPYQMLLTRGERQKAEVRVQNYRSAPMQIEVAPITPQEWRVEPEVLKFEVPPKSHAVKPFYISVPRTWESSSPRFAIAADVMSDGKYLGQITEAVVEIA